MENNEEFILGYQWSPVNKKYMGEYRFPNNKDKEEIHMPPFTTLIKPLETEKGFISYWDGDAWFIDVDPDVVTEHDPIPDYEMLMPDYIDYLKSQDLWTEDDENKRQEALDNIQKRLEDQQKEIEELEKNRDYLSEFRGIRNELLQQSDWTQMPDVQNKLTEEEKEEVLNYRQNLRDLPENIENPKELVLNINHPSWPINPL